MNNNRLYILIGIIFFVLFIGCNKKKIDKTEYISDVEEYNVYEFIIDSLTTEFQKGEILIGNRIKYFSKYWKDENGEIYIQYLGEYIESISGKFNDEIYMDVLKKGLNLLAIDSTYIVDNTKLIYYSPNRLKKYIKNSILPFDKFLKENPDYYGVINFSRVGFNKEKNKSFVNCNLYCGSLCGWGFLCYLEKDNNKKWQIIKIIGLWEA